MEIAMTDTTQTGRGHGSRMDVTPHGDDQRGTGTSEEHEYCIDVHSMTSLRVQAASKADAFQAVAAMQGVELTTTVGQAVVTELSARPRMRLVEVDGQPVDLVGQEPSFGGWTITAWRNAVDQFVQAADGPDDAAEHSAAVDLKVMAEDVIRALEAGD
jgi:hypothetical protein